VLPVCESLGIVGRALASSAASTVHQAGGLLEKVVSTVEAVKSRILVLGLQAARPDHPVTVVIPEGLSLLQVSIFVSSF